jgi:hypothetical protein
VDNQSHLSNLLSHNYKLSEFIPSSGKKRVCSPTAPPPIFRNLEAAIGRPASMSRSSRSNRGQKCRRMRVTYR